MFQLLMFFIMFIFSTMFNLLNNPLMLSLILFFQILMICLLMNLLTNTIWFSYILFLVFIGGILIIFIYVISLISYEKFNLNKMFYLILTSMSISIIMSYFYYKMNLNNFDMKNFMNIFLFEENSMNLNKLYNFPTNLINIFLINYLFLMLIITMKLTNFFFGPLRSKT